MLRPPRGGRQSRPWAGCAQSSRFLPRPSLGTVGCGPQRSDSPWRVVRGLALLAIAEVPRFSIACCTLLCLAALPMQSYVLRGCCIVDAYVWAFAIALLFFYCLNSFCCWWVFCSWDTTI